MLIWKGDYRFRNNQYAIVFGEGVAEGLEGNFFDRSLIRTLHPC